MTLRRIAAPSCDLVASRVLCRIATIRPIAGIGYGAHFFVLCGLDISKSGPAVLLSHLTSIVMLHRCLICVPAKYSCSSGIHSAKNRRADPGVLRCRIRSL